MSITKEVYIEQILEKINDIIQQYGVRKSQFIPITIEQVENDLSELGLDSVSFIRLIVSLEEEYSIEFEDENLILSNMNTVKKIFIAVQRCLKF